MTNPRHEAQLERILSANFDRVVRHGEFYDVVLGTASARVSIVEHDGGQLVNVTIVMPLLTEVPSTDELRHHLAMDFERPAIGNPILVPNGDGTCEAVLYQPIPWELLAAKDLVSTIEILYARARELTPKLQSKFGGRIPVLL